MLRKGDGRGEHEGVPNVPVGILDPAAGKRPEHLGYRKNQRDDSQSRGGKLPAYCIGGSGGY